MSDIEQLPPHNIEAELAVLGAILIDPPVITEIADIIEEKSFFRVAHGQVYRAMLDLYEEGEEIDFLSVTDLLRRRVQLEDAGGEGFVVSLLNAVPTSVNVATYARIVANAATRRRMLSAAQRMAQLAYDEDENISVALSRAEGELLTINDAISVQREEPRPARKYVRTVIDETETAANTEGDVLGIPTGLLDIDRLLGGLQKGDLIIIAGRPGMGKTSLQLMMALHAALYVNKRVAFFNLEMTGEQLVRRMLSTETKIDNQRLQRGNLAITEWPLFLEACGRLSETDFFIDDTPSLMPMQLRHRCKRIYMQHGLDIVFLDYLQLMESDQRYSNPVQAFTEISRSLKAIARELEVPVVVNSQLSRAVEQRADKRPILSDLRETGALEQDADNVMFIYRDEYYNPDTTDRPNIAEIHIAKHRNGPTGVVDLYWHGKLTAFRNLKRQEINLNGERPHAVATAGKY